MFLERLDLAVSQRQYFLAVGQGLDLRHHFGISLKQFYGEVSRREMTSDCRMRLEYVLDFG